MELTFAMYFAKPRGQILPSAGLLPSASTTLESQKTASPSSPQGAAQEGGKPMPKAKGVAVRLPFVPSKLASSMYLGLFPPLIDSVIICLQ